MTTPSVMKGLSFLDRFGPDAEILRSLTRHASWAPI